MLVASWVYIMKKKLCHLFILFGLFSLNSCALFNLVTGRVSAFIDCEDKRLYVVPLKMETDNNNLRFYDSLMGTKISAQMSWLINRNASDAKIAIANDELKSEIRNRFKNPDWVKICEKYKLDFIVFGSIVDYREVNRQDRALLQGKITVKLTVISKDGELLLPEEKFSVVFPREKSQDRLFQIGGSSALQMTREEIKQQLLAHMSKKLAEIFYDHKPEEH